MNPKQKLTAKLGKKKWKPVIIAPSIHPLTKKQWSTIQKVLEGKLSLREAAKDIECSHEYVKIWGYRVLKSLIFYGHVKLPTKYAFLNK